MRLREITCSGSKEMMAFAVRIQAGGQDSALPCTDKGELRTVRIYQIISRPNWIALLGPAPKMRPRPSPDAPGILPLVRRSLQRHLVAFLALCNHLCAVNYFKIKMIHMAYFLP